jgi:adhesin/invasin
MTLKPAVLCVLSFASVLSAAPRLVLTASSVGTVQAKAGANGPSQVVQAYNAGSGTLNLSVTSSASWLAAAAGPLTSCGANSAGCYPINISLNTASLALGTYTEYLTVADPNAVDSPQQIAVTVAVQGIPSSLSFYVTPAGGSNSEAQAGIYTTGTGAKGSVSTQSGGNWLVFVTNEGGIVPGAPYTIVAAAQVNQVPGVYNGTVTISSSASDNTTIPVTLTVTNSPIIPSTYSTLLLSGPAGSTVSGSVSFSNVGAGTLSVTSVTATSATANVFSATASGSGVTVTANATGLNPGIYHATVTIASNAANNAQVSVPAELTVDAAGTPLISTGAVVNVGNYFQESVAPGDIAAVFGDQFAPAGSALSNSGVPLPTSLGGVQVLVNGTPAPLYYVSPTQINFQMPYEAPAGQLSTVQVVNNSVLGNTRSIGVVAGSPRIILLPASVISGGYGAIINTDASITLPASNPVTGRTVHAAKAGDTVVIYCVGFGQTSPAATDGVAANFLTSSTPLQTNQTATVTFGGGFYGSPTSVTAAYTGLTPGSVGLYQVNATLPPDVPLGNTIPVTVTINGAISNFAFMAVSQ